MRKLISFLLLSFVAYTLQAQIKDPVKFKTELNSLSDTEAEIVFTAAIDKGWHVYSTDLGDGGPISATFNVEKKSGVELVGKLKPVGKEIATFDKLFEMKVRYFENTAKFVQKVKLTGGAYAIEGYLEYGACDDESCLPPTEVPFKFSGEAKAGTTAAPVAKADKPETKEAEEVTAPAASKDSAAMMELVPASATDANADIQPAVASGDLWRPVISELQALGEEHTQGDMSWIYIFVTGFLGGLLALFTPCVWPIIPMTVSFFLKHSKDKKKGIRDAWTYGASIVVIYVALGLAITLIFGASALNALSTNAVFNILFFLMLVIFAASFFGAFEIRLPSKWGNAVDSKAESTTGLLVAILMGFTPQEAASLGIIGGADGPTAIFTTIKLAPHLLGPIAIAAYSYMALVPVIIPLVVKLFCTKKELSINMKEQEKKYPSKTEIKNLRVLKIIFPIVVTTIVALFVPSAVPLIGMLMFGNLVKEIGSNTFRLFDAASNSIMNAATIFLGLSVGATMTAEAFLNWTTIGIVIGGFLAFALSITGGIFFVKLVNLFSKKKINPLIGATGLSAVPMASRVANEIALKYDPKNHVLQYCMASNISGVIGSAVAAGVLISFLA